MFFTNTRHLGRKPHFKDCTLLLMVFESRVRHHYSSYSWLWIWTVCIKCLCYRHEWYSWETV